MPDAFTYKFDSSFQHNAFYSTNCCCVTAAIDAEAPDTGAQHLPLPMFLHRLLYLSKLVLYSSLHFVGAFIVRTHQRWLHQ